MFLELIKDKYYMFKDMNALPVHITNKISSLSKGDIVIDCGANIGRISKIFASKGASVYAIEPDPDAFNVLQTLSERCKLITPINAAVGCEDKTDVKLYYHANRTINSIKYSQGSSLLQSKPNVSDKYEKVKLIDIARFIDKFESVKIIKIDIEGYEIYVVPHLLNSNILQKVNHVLIELHDKKWPELKEETKKMINEVMSSKYADKFYFDWP